MVPSVAPTRTVLHVDMDAFFASVELVRHPELRGRPVAVGGTGDRGVIAAASYEARVHGVRSAIPSARARRLCPDLVLLPGDHAHYAEVSARIMEIFRTVTPMVEPLSLDEAFLDVTGVRRLHGPPEELAVRLRRVVQEREGLTCSVGVAANRFLAKLASGDAKPAVGPAGVRPGPGVLVVPSDGELAYLHPLPVSRLWGVGPATLAKLRRIGVCTVGELAALPRSAVTAALGSATGAHLHEMSHGIDRRPVEPDRELRSVSHEETFAVDRRDLAEMRADLVRMADSVASRLRSDGVRARTVQLKVRFSDFRTVSRSRTLDAPTDHAPVLREEAWRMLGLLPVHEGVRLLGVGSSNLTRGPVVEQLSLDGAEDRSPVDRAALDGAVDEIRRRFGPASIGPGSAGDGRRSGEGMWGPDAADGPVPPSQDRGSFERSDDRSRGGRR